MNDKSPSILYSIPIIRDLLENENDLDYNPNAKKRAIIILSSIIICIFLFVFVVSLMISKHNNNLVKVITVPNCVSSSINEAKALLEESEITEDKYTFISTPSSIEEKDKIINQSIEAGTEIPENQILQLFFGDGMLSEEEVLEEIPIERVVFEPSELTMSVGDIQVFDIKVIPENSTEQYFITCDNYSVAFTDVNNNVHAFSPGEAKLIAKTVEGKIVGECHITINELDSATIQTDSFELPSQVYESTRAHETTQAYDAPQEWTDEETKTATARPPVTAESEPEAVSRPTAASKYTVYFNSDGGSVSPTSKTVTYGSSYGTLPTPTKSGYKFEGWYYGSEKITASSTVTVNSNHTLYAYWKQEETAATPKHIVYFDPDGGSVSPTSKTVTYGSSYGTLPTPTKSGYKFEGWYRYYGSEKITASSTVTVNGNHTLYASWKQEEAITTPKYTVYFNSDGGSVSTTSKTVTYGSSYGTLPTPTKSGYKFEGWYYGSGKITASSTVTVNGNHTLTAKWKEETTKPATQYKKGDINGDNLVNNKDYSLLCDRVDYGIPLNADQEKRADVNGDGKINESDVIELLKIMN